MPIGIKLNQLPFFPPCAALRFFLDKIKAQGVLIKFHEPSQVDSQVHVLCNLSSELSQNAKKVYEKNFTKRNKSAHEFHVTGNSR